MVIPLDDAREKKISENEIYVKRQILPSIYSQYPTSMGRIWISWIPEYHLVFSSRMLLGGVGATGRA
jgi:hypothetical protein